MIEIPTVLVLGAGASKPYGLPTGAELLDQVLNAGLPERLRAWEFEPSLTAQFQAQLRLSGTRSVDAFLERRKEYVPVGKTAMAHSLIPREQMDFLFGASPERDWYQYLWDKLRAPTLNAVRGNRLVVVTFNYDRSLEQYLLTVLQNFYGAPIEDAADVLKALPIVHVHGQLQGLRPLSKGRIYSHELAQESVRDSADGIRIINEGGSDDAVMEAQHYVSDAERIYFIGFGYHRDNIARLRLSSARDDVRTYGSALGSTLTEMESFRKRLGRADALIQEMDALQFLRNVEQLAD